MPLSARAASAVLVLALAAAAQSTVVIPNGTANAWGGQANAFPWYNNTANAGVHWQGIYDSWNLTAQNVTAPITITRLRWRSALSGSWTGGTYNLARVTLATAGVDYRLVTASFAANMGNDALLCYQGPVTYQAGNGNNTPGPWVVDIALTNPFTYDPAVGGLVIDLDYALPGNWSGGTVSSNDVMGPGSRSSRVYSTSQYPLPSGADVDHGVVCELTYAPATGHAWAHPYGHGCVQSAVSFYEWFNPGTFDLGGTATTANSIRLIPTGTGYTVQPGSNNWFTPISAGLGLGLGQVSGALPLPLPLTTPAGTTNNLYIAVNGLVFTDHTPNPSNRGDTDPWVLLTQGECFCPLWDWSWPTSGSINYDVDSTTLTAYATWTSVPESLFAATRTFQAAFMPGGIVEYRWMSCANPLYRALVGWSPGSYNRDGGGIDLSQALPFTTSTDDQGETLAATARPALGASLNLVLGNVPAGTSLGIVWFGHVPHDPGLALSAIGAPSCANYCDPRADVFVPISGATASTPVVVPANPVLAGLRVYSQALSFTGGRNPLGMLFTNGLDLKLDLY